jgi:hypothetical protein
MFSLDLGAFLVIMIDHMIYCANHCASTAVCSVIAVSSEFYWVRVACNPCTTALRWGCATTIPQSLSDCITAYMLIAYIVFMRKYIAGQSLH